MSPAAREFNFDGLVGPTHHYAGLSFGNIASQRSGGSLSEPRAAALEGLAKMKFLADLGVGQAVLPPQERPDLEMLRRVGFAGTDADLLRQAARDAPRILAASFSASSMWAANAATVCPSADSADSRVHFTAANLVSELHRSIEPPATAAVLRRIFADPDRFSHHDPLPATPRLRDEGAANHTRLCRSPGDAGLQLFIYGARTTPREKPSEKGTGVIPGTRREVTRKKVSDTILEGPKRYPARQAYEASAAIARLHGTDPQRTMFVRQHPGAIDAGVFHNDVIAVGNENVLFYHTGAFAIGPRVIKELQERFEQACGEVLVAIEVSADEVSLADSVDSYLFNSQLVSLPDGSMCLICPAECRTHPQVKAFLDRLVAGAGPIGSVHFVEVRQSMSNGGGPACLRLRVVLTDSELAATHQGVLFTERLHDKLVAWIGKHYRDRLSEEDLADPALIEEGRTALDELTRILGLGSIYAFQRC